MAVRSISILGCWQRLFDSARGRGPHVNAGGLCCRSAHPRWHQGTGASSPQLRPAAEGARSRAFCGWMRKQRGTCDATLYSYRRHVRDLLKSMGEDPGRFDDPQSAPSKRALALFLPQSDRGNSRSPTSRGSNNASAVSPLSSVGESSGTLDTSRLRNRKNSVPFRQGSARPILTTRKPTSWLTKRDETDRKSPNTLDSRGFRDQFHGIRAIVAPMTSEGDSGQSGRSH